MITKFLNANSDLGVHIKGASKGPRFITEKLNVSPINIDFELLKDDLKERKINLNSINNLNEKIYNEILKIKDFTILIGGDHSVSIASSLASIKKEESLGIIWIDAHGDYNDFNTTITGNIHGLPLASVCNSNGSELTYFHKGNFFKPQNAVIFGARDLDIKEEEKIKNDKINVFYYNDIKGEKLEKALNEAFNIALKNTNGVHISFDLDSIDPLIAPGVTVPAQGGFNTKDIEIITKVIKKNISKVKSFDLVEYNPIFDKNDKTLNIAVDIIKKIIE